jgi:hypothetical protein
VQYHFPSPCVYGWITPCRLDTLYVDLARYTEKPVATLKKLFEYWFDKAAWHRPTVLVFDNIESLFGVELEVCPLFPRFLLNINVCTADSTRNPSAHDNLLNFFSRSTRPRRVRASGTLAALFCSELPPLKPHFILFLLHYIFLVTP